MVGVVESDGKKVKWAFSRHCILLEEKDKNKIDFRGFGLTLFDGYENIHI